MEERPCFATYLYLSLDWPWPAPLPGLRPTPARLQMERRESCSFTGTRPYSELTAIELSLSVHYAEPITVGTIDHLSFDIGDVHFNVPAQAIFEGYHYALDPDNQPVGDPLGSFFSFNTGPIALSPADAGTLLADFQDFRLPFTILNPPPPDSLSGPWSTGVYVRVYGPDDGPGSGGDPTPAPEPVTLLLWACGLFALAPLKRLRRS